MTPAPVQAAAAAALGDDEHVREQQARYARRRAVALARARGARAGARRRVVDLLPVAARRRPAPSDGWAIAADLATTGLLVAPGDFYGDASTDHVRVALTLTDDADRARCASGLTDIT